MSLSLRVNIARPADNLRSGEAASAPPPQSATSSADTYVSRLVKMIPGEALALFAAGAGLIAAARAEWQPNLLLVWSLISALAIIALRRKATLVSDRSGPQWISTAIALVSFAIWLYSQGAPFIEMGDDFEESRGVVSSLLILAWTFFIPLFYKGD